jgi:hypothetical protein
MQSFLGKAVWRRRNETNVGAKEKKKGKKRRNQKTNKIAGTLEERVTEDLLALASGARLLVSPCFSLIQLSAQK